ncbi:Adenylate kinase 5, chloroplastic [Porphyridium purpureum]|uniref:Adenylate kinase 5, chloroplastic n=1 Tax=Porphyridium purpureum TaxID=35688 RepID=A0A5J4Z1R4_PORPP|nr:Adenylate kinase 5, chloroplastic [Porphyridium purpureum]|eukprot:POR3747..scf208_2
MCAVPFTELELDEEHGVQLVKNSRFTPRINQSPMSAHERAFYTDTMNTALVTAIDDVRQGKVNGSTCKNVMSATVLLPELNPALDIYDRRFLIKVIWDLVMRLADDRALTVQMMTQSATQFGGLPLSVAGLQKTLAADIRASSESWSEGLRTRVRLADLGPEHVTDDVDVFIFVSPTNAQGAPVVEQVMSTVERIGSERPILLINPRLGEVPSHSGVMQVQGRRERLDFVGQIPRAFVMELLYKSGTWYPLRGILFRAYPGDFELWKRWQDITVLGAGVQAEKIMREEFELLHTWPASSPPSRTEISDHIQNASRASLPANYEGSSDSDMSTASPTPPSSVPITFAVPVAIFSAALLYFSLLK